MKLITTAALLISLSFNAAAEGNSKVCQQQSMMFRKIAEFRDNGYSPQEALEEIPKFTVVPTELHKDAINLVYFGKDFQYMSGEGMQSYFYDLCIEKIPAYTPLK